jgi:hypothetical protein
MAAERVYGGTGLIDVLDRILDKGLVIDVWVRVSVVGLELITVEARVVVASVDTYLKYAQAIGLTPLASRPPLEQGQGAVSSAQSTPRGPAREPARLLGGQDGSGGGGLLDGLTQPLQGLIGGQNSDGQSQGGQASQQELVSQLQSILSQLQQGQGANNALAAPSQENKERAETG